MKKVRINSTLRSKLETYVRHQIEAGMDTIPLEEARRSLEAEAVRLLQEAYPREEMALLVRYGLADRYRRFTFRLPGGEERSVEFENALPYELPRSGGYRFESEIPADAGFLAAVTEVEAIEQSNRVEARRRVKQAGVLIGCALYFEDVLDFLGIPAQERVTLSQRWHLPQITVEALKEPEKEDQASEPEPEEAASPDPFEVDIQAALERQCQIAAIWSIDDVREIRPELTDHQAWEVLQRVAAYHDASHGITWQSLEDAAADLYPETEAA